MSRIYTDDASGNRYYHDPCYGMEYLIVKTEKTAKKTAKKAPKKTTKKSQRRNIKRTPGARAVDEALDRAKGKFVDSIVAAEDHRALGEVTKSDDRDKVTAFMDEVQALARARGITALVAAAGYIPADPNGVRLMSTIHHGEIFHRLDLAARLYGTEQGYAEHTMATLTANARNAALLKGGR